MLRQKCDGVGELLALRDIVRGSEVSGGLAVVALEGCEGDVYRHARSIGADVVPVGLSAGAVAEQKKERVEADRGDARVATGLAHHAIAELLRVVEVDDRGVTDDG